MSIHYRTRQGDTLDWICWHYYIHEVSLGTAAMATDPRLSNDSSVFDSGFMLNNQTDESLRGVIETVLNANPGLANYPLSLPPGIAIALPEFTPELIESESVKLWD